MAQRPQGSVKDMSKDREESKKKVALNKADLQADFARVQAAWMKKHLPRLKTVEDHFTKRIRDLDALKKLQETLTEEDERRKRTLKIGEDIAEGLEKAVKDLVKFKVELIREVRIEAPGGMPKPQPPTGGDAVALMLWVTAWLMWMKLLRKKLP